MEQPLSLHEELRLRLSAPPIQTPSKITFSNRCEFHGKSFETLYMFIVLAMGVADITPPLQRQRQLQESDKWPLLYMDQCGSSPVLKLTCFNAEPRPLDFRGLPFSPIGSTLCRLAFLLIPRRELLNCAEGIPWTPSVS
jgi:hypothetical protein